MRKFNLFVLLFVIAITSCKNETPQQVEVPVTTITNEIIHDVEINYVPLEGEEIDDSSSYNYINKEGRISWLTKLFEDVKSGKIKAYKPYSTMEEKDLMDLEFVNSLFYEKIGEENVLITEDRVLLMRFYETWSYDENMVLTKKVKAYGPIRNVIDPVTGDIRGKSVMFLIKQE